MSITCSVTAKRNLTTTRLCWSMDFGFLGILELISFIEDTFGIKVSDEEILPENLDSIGGISRFILRKLPEPLAERLPK